MPRLLALCLLLLVNVLPRPALAWGSDGHRVVAGIALRLLPPAKAAELEALLRHSAIGQGFVEASTYPDLVIRPRDAQRQFGPWHYVNWPEGPGAYDPAACRPSCILGALPQNLALGHAAEPERRALALAWVLHLVGDLHQPLHVADRADRGGNDLPVELAEPGQRRTRRLNLHQLWDDALVQAALAGQPPEAVADTLRAGRTGWRGDPRAVGDLMAWTTQSHALGSTVVYPGILAGQPLPPGYVAHAVPVVREQLLRAGIRLARLVDEAF